MFACAQCHQVVVICRHCDRGQRYCSTACAQAGRRVSLRDAGRRYQQTPLGRRNNAIRQKRYRIRSATTVTHQSSPAPRLLRQPPDGHAGQRPDGHAGPRPDGHAGQRLDGHTAAREVHDAPDRHHPPFQRRQTSVTIRVDRPVRPCDDPVRRWDQPVSPCDKPVRLRFGADPPCDPSVRRCDFCGRPCGSLTRWVTLAGWRAPGRR